jgi:hypothetical protein
MNLIKYFRKKLVSDFFSVYFRIGINDCQTIITWHCYYFLFFSLSNNDCYHFYFYFLHHRFISHFWYRTETFISFLCVKGFVFRLIYS